jgi:hypothetical protein
LQSTIQWLLQTAPTKDRRSDCSQSGKDERSRSYSQSRKNGEVPEQSKYQLNTLTSRSRTRVLELRSNPTANHEAIKLSTLNTLRAENAALLAQLRGQDLTNVPVVPAATVDNLTMQLSRLQAEVSSAQK